MSRPAQSISTQSNNILLKVTVPKRTGRKRKRGSDGPFVEDPACVNPGNAPPRPTAREVLRTLRDNEGKYQVEPVGLIERTHVFRGMFSINSYLLVYAVSNDKQECRILSSRLQAVRSSTGSETRYCPLIIER
jgi:hypothetical protein